MTSIPERRLSSIDDRFKKLLFHLGRGGAYQYWCSFGKGDPAISSRRNWTRFWPVGEPPPLDLSRDEERINVYFNVHPLKHRPARGRGKIEAVAAINCLFAEFDCTADGKQASTSEMMALFRRINQINPKPTFVVKSGGGYHCYWLIDEPYLLDRDEAVLQAQAWQRAWVRFVGGETDAADLARVLRVPGTQNVKAKRDNGNPRPVIVQQTRWDAIYSLSELTQCVDVNEDDYRTESDPVDAEDAPVAAQPTPSVAQTSTSTSNPNRLRAYAAAGLAQEVARIRSTPESGGAANGRNNQLNHSSYTMHRKVARGWIDGETVRAELEAAGIEAGLDPEEVRQTVASGSKGLLNPAPDPVNRNVGRITITATVEDDNPKRRDRDQHLTDLGNARRLVARYGEHLRYVPTWGKWFVYRDGRWRLDELNEVYRCAHRIVAELHQEAQALQRQVQLLSAGEPDEETQKLAVNLDVKAKALGKWAMQTESRDRLNAMVQVGQHDERVATSHHAFDADPFLLAVANGVLDLRSGRLDAHSPDYLLRSGSDVVFDPSARCPTWISFLDWATSGDEELQTYLQRIVGYTLTGETSEQCYFFLYGPGGNGKSTFVNVVAQLLGDLFAKAPIDMVLSLPNTQIPNDLARLPGKRMASLGEMKTSKQGPMRFDEAKIKDFTGGDTITARLLHQEWFDFKPQFKLWIYGNHKPDIRGDDQGLARRTRLVPFLARLDERATNKRLGEQLRRELSGILNWALVGCLDWQSEGLTTPRVVADATSEYLQTQDAIGVWIAEQCVTGPAHSCGTRKLYQLYRVWCDQTGEDKLSEKAFATALDNKGYTRRRGMDGSLRLGIAIKPKDEENHE